MINEKCEMKTDGYNSCNSSSASVTADTKFYITQKLEKLPLPMIELLKVAACFSSAYVEEKLIEHVLDYPIQSLILEAVNLNILVPVIGYDNHNTKKLHIFIHNEVRNGIYNLIPETSRELFHLEIGRRLWRHLHHDEIDQYLFVILYQLHIGCRLISRTTERYRIATLCLHAGRKAAKSSTFRAALVYLKFGIQLLGTSGWREEYELSLMLHNAAAEMELCNANFEGMDLLVKTIIQNSRSDKDTIPAKTTLLHGLVINSKQQEGLRLGQQLLNILGCGLRQKFNKLTFFLAMRSVARLLKGKSDEYLRRLPIMTDEKMLSSMHILSLMFMHALLMRPELAFFIGLKMVELTFTHGLCYWSPLAFEAYGMLCLIVFSSKNDAFRFGELGLDLIERLQLREYIPRVYAVYYYCIHPWRYPMRDSLRYLLQAYYIGLQTGDIEFSFVCAVMWLSISYDCGNPLNEIDLQCSRFYRSILSHRQKSLHYLTLPPYYAVKYHRGGDVDSNEIEAVLEHSFKNDIQMLQFSVLWYRAEIAFIYNDIEKADKLLFEANTLDKIHQQYTGTPDVVLVTLLNGMIAFACLDSSYKGKRLRKRQQYMQRGKAMLKQLKIYSQWCPDNFAGHKFLLEAELAVVCGQLDRAMEKYICAITMSKENRSLFVHALANERVGRFCFHTLKRRHDATNYFTQALLAYQEWNGTRKVAHLRAELFDMYGTEAFKHCS